MRKLLAFVAVISLFSGCKAPAPPPGSETDAITQPPSIEAVVASTPSDGCISLKQWQEKGLGTLQNSDTATEDTWVVHLAVTVQEQTVKTDVDMNTGRYVATVIDPDDVEDATSVCGGHVFVVNYASERGGILLIANLHDGKLIATLRDYMSGDEETISLDFKENKLQVSSETDGTYFLVEDTSADASAPYSYVPESIRCDASDEVGSTMFILYPDVNKRVYAIDYLSFMHDSKTSCAVDATRNNMGDTYPTTWEDKGDTTAIIWKDDENAEDDNSDHDGDQPRISITHDGAFYTIDNSMMRSSLFCGQSAQLAETIKLKRGEPDCLSVEWPK